ncbi:hypothetical protein Q31b_32020 [Novipirellula aureliae]|uniref:Uncharacterized protein n=1 Tax=Novipirellula aureliae TaxID=2527966 RepID=A0A5C6DVA5_9BACT|nr:hypothetical protein Q31b_32020 [Novipirellula aureliae]
MRSAADRLGVSEATVCYHVANIRRLPEKLVEWLESKEAEEFCDILLERRLRKIVQLQGSEKSLAINDVLFRYHQKSGCDSSINSLLLMEKELGRIVFSSVLFRSRPERRFRLKSPYAVVVVPNAASAHQSFRR